MRLNNGYIALTDSRWCKYCREDNIKQVCIWTRKKSFKVCMIGDPIFFLEKGTRLIQGYGIFKSFHTISLQESWNKYGISLGAADFPSLLNILGVRPTDSNLNKDLGIIQIEMTKWFNPSFNIDDLQIDFHKAIVSGKRISSVDIQKILNCEKKLD
ncbi:hypothetical protein [Priestia koreensis]|uniref:hypothetical protein n=1 Tax=Priestia koreensis TaxID=284581 RepID=UPI00345B246D